MPYKEISDLNGTETQIVDLFTYSAGVVSVLVPLILFSVFIMSTLGSYFAQKRATGVGDFPGSFAVGSWITAIIAVSFSLIPDFIRTGTLVFTFALAIMGAIWLYMSRVGEGL